MAMVRTAEFRRRYSQSNQRLLPIFGDEPAEPSDCVYAILLHGPHELDPATPAFVHIVFPNGDCSAYLDHIDLLKDVVDEANDEEVERMPDEAPVYLRADRQRKKGDA